MFHLLVFLFSIPSWGLDPQVVFTWPECQGQKSQWNSDNVAVLKNSQDFFLPNDPLNTFSQRIQKFNKWEERNNCQTQKQGMGSYFHHPPHPLAKVTDQLQTEVLNQLDAEVQVQKNLIDNTILCTEEEIPKHLEKQCKDLRNELIPELQERLSTMRVLKSLADNNEKPLAHDKALTSELLSSVFPTLWKKDSQTQLSPLSEKELQLRSDFVKMNVTPDEAEGAYYGILSSTPALLFFDQEVNLQNLNVAFKKLKEQNVYDQEALAKNPPQELLLMPELVGKAIQKLPPGQKGDACLAVSEIYRNLHIEYERTPLVMAFLSLVAGSRKAPLKVLKKSILPGRAPKIAVAGAAAYGTLTLKSWDAYQRGAQFCSSQAVNNERFKSKVCNFKSVSEVYKDLEFEAGATLTLGLSVGAMALLRKARELRQLKK